MSSNEKEELKAGHAPAVKAGGMRVARTHHSSTGEAAPPKPDAEEQEEYADPATKEEKVNVDISGALSKGDQDFPPAAVKQFHEKPSASKEQRPPQPQQKHHIQQPR